MALSPTLPNSGTIDRYIYMHIFDADADPGGYGWCGVKGRAQPGKFFGSYKVDYLGWVMMCLRGKIKESQYKGPGVLTQQSGLISIEKCWLEEEKNL
jgi:hypothetical protein